VKRLTGTASAVIAAPIEECFSLLAAVEAYPSWYAAVVRGVEVIDVAGDGRPSTVRTTLHVSYGPLARDFPLVLAIDLEQPGAVTLTRLPNDASDHEEFEVIWRLENMGRTRIALELDAKLDLPRLVPLGGIGDGMADGFVGAASRALGC
jgi:hypothetical protein